MDTKGSERRRDGAARKRWALSCALAFALAAGGCGREPAEAVAPFGGALASAIPDRDVIGFVRARSDDPRLAWLLDSIGEFEPAIAASVGGPLLHMARLAREGQLVAAGQPFALLLLDPSVHGALFGFAWRGAAAPFLARARADGLRVDGERVWLPGAARVAGVESVAQMAGSYLDERGEEGDAADPPDVERPATRYHLVERDGLSLLLPARDGAQHVAAALAATQLLDPATGDGFCARLELGAVLDQSREEVRNHVASFASSAIWRFSDETFGRGDDRESSRRAARDAYFSIWRVARDLIHGSLDWLIAIDHLLVREEAGRCDLFLRAGRGEFFEKTLDAWAPRPPAELLAGAPADAKWLLAAAVDPAVVGGLPERWRALRRTRPRGSFDRHDDDAEERVPFIESFGGRLWLAVAPPPDGPRAPSLLDLLPIGRKPEAESAGARGDEQCLRLWAELRDEENSGGLLASVIEEAVPPNLLPVVRLAAVPLYSVERLGGGCVEVVGSEPASLIAAERERLRAPPAAVAWKLPAGAPERASVVGRFALPERAEPGWLALQRDARGLWLSFWWPER